MKHETRVQTLRRRASESLGSKYPMQAETLLERLASVAMDGSEDALFAHRHLAELRLERSPWKAALHLRRVLAARPDDHVPHALMGLCQALLSNYGMAVASYRRAVRLAPKTPGYHHNLGHFLDIGLDRPREALTYLAKAHELAPSNADIASSFAHALARCGNLGDALLIARDAARLAPTDPGHQRLIRWIEQGAPETVEPPNNEWTEVSEKLRKYGTNPDAAIALGDECARKGTACSNSAAMAAALDYLTSDDQSQKVVAARHGVGVSTLAKRVAVARRELSRS